MNIRVKTYTIIVVTLIIGALCGILLTRTLVRGHFERMMRRPPQGEFIQRFMRVIEPTPEQEKMLRAVLEKQEIQFTETARRCQEKFAALHEATMKELTPLLTPEQKKRLERRIRRIRKRLPPLMRGRGPFPPPHRPRDKTGDDPVDEKD